MTIDPVDDVGVVQPPYYHSIRNPRRMARMPACWMEPDPPPIPLIFPALTLVGVTFTLGFAYCGSLKMLVLVISMRNVGPSGRPVNLNRLCSPKCHRFRPGPSIAPRSAVPKRPTGGAPN